MLRLALSAVIVLLVAAPAHAESRSDLLKKKGELEERLSELLRTKSETDDSVVMTLNDLGRIHFELADYKKALKIFKTVEKNRRVSTEQTRRSQVYTILDIARCYDRLGKEKDRDRAVKKGIKKARKWAKGEELYRILDSIARDLHYMGHWKLAGELYKECYDGLLVDRGKNAQRVLMAALGYSACLVEQGEYDQARPIILDTIERFEEHHPTDTTLISILKNNLAYLYMATDDHEAAKALLEPMAKDAGEGPGSWLVRMNLAETLAALKEYEACLQLTKKLIAELKTNKAANSDSIDRMKKIARECRKGLEK